MQHFLSTYSLKSAEKELEKINVSTVGCKVMAEKMNNFNIKIYDLTVGEANIIKQEMISSGGDAAVAKGVAEGITSKSDIIIMGNLSILKKFSYRLGCHKKENFYKIKLELDNLIESYKKRNKNIISKLNLDLNKPNVMGILNITPDSFSDGNENLKIENVIKKVKKMIEDGVKIIDVGGESTRPGSKPVSEKDELKRVIPVIREIRKISDITISVDTYKSVVAREAISAGANIINDIYAMRKDLKMIDVLKEFPKVPIILMHMQGIPEFMQDNPNYEDLILEELKFFNERIGFCLKNGIDIDRIIIDPGIGFGKRQEDNLLILQKLEEFHSLNVPILLGTSRKSFINNIYKSEPKDRLTGTLATSVIAYNNDVAIIRVHDVLENVRIINTLSKIYPK